MKAKNQFGLVLDVPDDWTEEILREKSLVAVVESPVSANVEKVSTERKGDSVTPAKNYWDMSLEKLKFLARRRKIHIGRFGKKRIVEKLMESDD